MIHPSLDYLTYFSSVFGIAMIIINGLSLHNRRASDICLHDVYQTSSWFVCCGWSWPEKFSVMLLDVTLTRGSWMPSCTGSGDAAKPVLFLPLSLRAENSKNLKPFVCYLALAKWTFVVLASLFLGTVLKHVPVSSPAALCWEAAGSVKREVL